MPYGDRRQVAVNSPADGTFLHGFNTDVSEATSTALGHVAVTEANLNNVIFGINSPKPATAKKFFGTNGKGYEQSFIDEARIAAARADGWEIKPRKIMTFGNTTFARVCYVEANISEGNPNTYFFAWRMPLWQYNAITAEEKTALDIRTYNPANDTGLQLVFGVTDKRNKAKRARKRTVTNGRARVIQTYVDYQKKDDLPVGWT